MMRLISQYVAILFISFLSIHAQESVTWNLDNNKNIGACKTDGLTELPEIINTSLGKAALYNGKDQAFLIKCNPLDNVESFTIEVLIKPDSSTNPDNLEQRFIHIGKDKNSISRILIELRLLEKSQKWALDSYLGSENSSLALLDTVHSEMLHPAGEWYNVAIVYKNNKITNYVNGKKELSGDVEFHPLMDAQISIGARQNPRSWFKGIIKAVRFTKDALDPKDFMKLTDVHN